MIIKYAAGIAIMAGLAFGQNQQPAQPPTAAQVQALQTLSANLAGNQTRMDALIKQILATPPPANTCAAISAAFPDLFKQLTDLLALQASDTDKLGVYVATGVVAR